ncbi:GvpL/GvpF family gas vesicle protein [Kitasatospora sp. NPDC093550]|uniref:GvpL/GvpF family gas vesicle protein n=1 Tax=Kitasatospora sp. NPDC093550 TaxID=3364089 RepID=UPI0038121777
MSTQPPTYTWLYAVTVTGADHPVPPGLTGVAGEALHVVAATGLSALAGAVPRTDFDEEPLRARLEDAAWLERAVRTHHHVVDTLARTAPVLPLRFATLYRDDRRAAAMLDEHRDELLASLRRTADRVEWGVKAYLAPTGPPTGASAGGADAGSTDAGNADAGSTDAAGGGTPPDPADRPGTAYLLRRRAHRRLQEQALRQAADDAVRVHAALARSAVEAVHHPLQPPEATGRAEQMVLNGAYLVEQARTAAFHEAVEALSARFPGLLLETTGPWPPYSFTTTPREEEPR